MSYFAPTCPVHAGRVLLDSSCIDGLHPHPAGGVSIDFRCWCGYTGTLHPGGHVEDRVIITAEVSPAAGRRVPVGATAG